MTISFCLPDLGEGVHEAEILEVFVISGQSVAEGDPILEVETDKAAVEIPSPTTGVVSDVLVKNGDMVNVGEVLLIFDTADTASLVSKEEEAASNARKETIDPASQNKGKDKRRPVPAAPSTRRLARELKVDLYQVLPTGPSGLVTAEDVRKAAENTAASEVRHLEADIIYDPVPSSIKPVSEDRTNMNEFGPLERLPFRSIRRETARRMAYSWSQIPHVNCQDTVDISRLENFRQRHKKEIEKAGGRLTMTVFALKAVATALKNYPYFNATLDLDHQEIVVKKYFNIGIAVDTEHGLMVPVIRDVDRKSIKELSVELHDKIQRARERKLTREELIGGSFTITNAGAIGGSHFSAIINHPEIAILGLGQGRMQPAVVTDAEGNHQIEPRLLMPLVFCFDHRVADGAEAIRFMQVIIRALQDPDELLITMI
jgi:pyruvate dehydrogenase E2 component (dihydrolipoamide acetyltransferase)